MTISAAPKPGNSELVTIRAAYGPITFEIDEPKGHALYFARELVRMLEPKPEVPENA